MFSLKVLFSFCLNFCQFQPGVVCKIVAYKKKHVFDLSIINANYVLCYGRSQRDAGGHSPPQVSTTFDTTLMEVVFPLAFQQFQLSLWLVGLVFFR